MKLKRLLDCICSKITGETKPTHKRKSLTVKFTVKLSANPLRQAKPESNRPLIFPGDKYDDHEKTLAEIRKLYEQKMSYRKIAKELGMSTTTVARRIAEIRKTA